MIKKGNCAPSNSVHHDSDTWGMGKRRPHPNLSGHCESLLVPFASANANAEGAMTSTRLGNRRGWTEWTLLFNLMGMRHYGLAG
jgi:hypothetical protein